MIIQLYLLDVKGNIFMSNHLAPRGISEDEAVIGRGCSKIRHANGGGRRNRGRIGGVKGRERKRRKSIT